MLLKNDLKENYSQIPNEILTDLNLSAGARLIYCYLASKPSGWKVWNADISKSLGIKNEKTISKYFKELIESEWITRRREQLPDGKFVGGYEYILQVPYHQNIRITKNTVSPKNGDYSNTNLYSNTELNSNISSTNQSCGLECGLESFNLWWLKYPRKVSKGSALKSFNSALKKTDLNSLLVGLDKYISYIQKNKTEKQYIKHPSTWLNQECWLDEYDEITSDDFGTEVEERIKNDD